MSHLNSLSGFARDMYIIFDHKLRQPELSNNKTDAKREDIAQEELQEKAF